MQSERNLKKKKERQPKRIHGIRLVTRLGKDSLCSSFPSLETHEVSKITAAVFDATLKPPTQKSCVFLLPKHAKNKTHQHCVSEQDIDHVCSTA